MNKTIIKKYLEGRCTPDEVQAIKEWIKSPEATEDLSDELLMEWQNLKVEESDKRDWEMVIKNIRDRAKKKEDASKIAFERSTDKNALRPAYRASASNSWKRKRKTFAIPVLFVILLAISASIVYFQGTAGKQPAAMLTETIKKTHKGQKLSFQLPDGTKIILNSNSEITYHSNYGDIDRRVRLEGEAFFEVIRDEVRPFQVITGAVTTTALGTSFNINSTRENDKVEIALVTGKVSVEKEESEKDSMVILMPGEMAVAGRLAESIEKSVYDYNQVMSWKNNIIYFKDANYYKMVKTLENWYGVNIHSNKIPDPDWKFSGKFENESLENVLEVLKYGHKMDYEINGKNVQLKF